MATVNQLVKDFKKSRNTVFFTGSEIEPSINTDNFKSLQNTAHSPGTLLTAQTLASNPELLEKFWKERLTATEGPTEVHKHVAEAANKHEALIITQSIDGRYQQAGALAVLELNGNSQLVCPVNCNNQPCRHTKRPNITLQRENPNPAGYVFAQQALQRADLVITLGTTLAAFPASGLLSDIDAKIWYVHPDTDPKLPGLHVKKLKATPEQIAAALANS